MTTARELKDRRDSLLKRLAEIQAKTVRDLVVHKQERARINAELDDLEIALESLDEK